MCIRDRHSVKELTSLGIQPDLLLCRTDRYLEPNVKGKIALFCNVDESAVITAKDVECVYEVPLVFHQEGLDERIVEKLNMWTGAPNLGRWEKIVAASRSPEQEINVAMVGKYAELIDSYKSINEALAHGGFANECGVNIVHIDSEQLENNVFPTSLISAHAILVPMGFGRRGAEGKISAIQYAREHDIPFLGICFGMQMAVVEFARHVCGLNEANSTEVNETTSDPVIALMDEQREIVQKGGSMLSLIHI